VAKTDRDGGGAIVRLATGAMRSGVFVLLFNCIAVKGGEFELPEQIQPTQHLRVTAYDQPPVFGNPKAFRWEAQAHPAVEELRSLYRLTDIAGEGTDWEQALRLLNWVHTRADHNGWNAAPQRDAHALLQHAAAGGSLRCVEYSHLLTQVLSAVGIPARVVYLRRKNPERGFGAGHVVVEAWINQFRKWVLLDPQCNAYWTWCGMPQGALELRRLRLGGRTLFLHRATQKWSPLDRLAKYVWAQYFHHCLFYRAGDYYGLGEATFPVPWRYWDQKAAPAFEFQGLNVAEAAVSDWSQVNFTCNAVTIQLRSPAPGEPFAPELLAELSHCTPWFAQYEIRFDDGEWQATDGAEPLAWRLRPGSNRIEARTVNQLGRRGIPSTIALTVSH
jgi:hypothetical protein